MRLLCNTTSPFVRIARMALAEKGIQPELVMVDPWDESDARLRQHNLASRVPSLVLDDGTSLSESLIIVQWVEAKHPAPQWPSLLGGAEQIDGVMARAAVAFGAIDASVITLITRKVSQPTPFDDTTIGGRRRRTMVEALQQLDAYFAQVHLDDLVQQVPTLDVICAITLHDYMRFRYGGLDWMPKTVHLTAMAERMRERSSVQQTIPH